MERLKDKNIAYLNKLKRWLQLPSFYTLDRVDGDSWLHYGVRYMVIQNLLQE